MNKYLKKLTMTTKMINGELRVSQKGTTADGVTRRKLEGLLRFEARLWQRSYHWRYEGGIFNTEGGSIAGFWVTTTEETNTIHRR